MGLSPWSICLNFGLLKNDVFSYFTEERLFVTLRMS